MKIAARVIKPPRLEPGDTIGIISPSWGGAGMFPHRVKQGVSALERLGFSVEFAPNALNQRGYVSDTAENRAQDIHDLFADPKITAVISAIGGDHSCHLLPLLDFDLIAANPKVFMGFSDTTVLNVAIWQEAGLVTFNGPALLTDFAEYPQMLSYTQAYFKRAVMTDESIGPIEPSLHWTEEFLDWEEKADATRPRRLASSPGWTWLKAGQAEGRLIGGCLESLQHLRGTAYWPDWEDAIFFFETSEEKPTPETVDGILMDYQNMGVFEQIRGMLIGRPMSYSDTEKAQVYDRVLERTQGYSFPIIADMDFGHTSPQLTLPLGCRARIDTEEGLFEIVDAAVG